MGPADRRHLAALAIARSNQAIHDSTLSVDFGHHAACLSLAVREIKAALILWPGIVPEPSFL